MTQFVTPVGRLVQGNVIMVPQKDMETGKPLLNNDGTPQMGVFLALAFPKNVNGEFDAFWSLVKQEAATAWSQLFPQGAAGACVNPRFSWKYQDGDGVDHNGQSVAGKAGFAGHHIVKFYSAYPLRCYNEGQFSPHQELQKPDEVIKRGDWIRIVGDVRGNNASGNQVPGVSLYPSLVSFVGRGERITSGPDAATTFGHAAVGYVPPGVSQHPAGVPSVAVPPVSGIKVPVPTFAVAPPVPPAPPAPTYVVAPALAAQGITVAALLNQGWTLETAAAQGHLIKQ